MTDVYGAGSEKANKDYYELESTPSDDGLPSEFLTRRLSFLKEAILHLVQQMKERRVLRDKFLHRLDEEQCTLGTRRYELPVSWFGLNPQLDRVRLEIDREIGRLELEKLKETTAYWKDLVQLKCDIIDYVREYDTLAEKLEILSGKRLPRLSFQELLSLVEEARQELQGSENDEPSEIQLKQLRRIP